MDGESKRLVAAVVLALALTVSAPAALADGSCVRLSRDIAALLAEQDALRRSFWQEPAHEGAAVLATSFTVLAYPALGYLAGAAVERLPRRRQIIELQARIDVLRALAAEQLCYVDRLYHY